MVSQSMQRMCAWCGNAIGKKSPDENDMPITHGICKGCLGSLLAEYSETTGQFLDKMTVPILVVNSNVELRFANKAACKTLDKPLSEMENKLGGDIIECFEATKPGGCGMQFHCTSCTIRLTVRDTYRSGESHVDVPAYPDVMQYGERRRLCMRISTQKVGEFVLLRIDDLREDKNPNAKSPDDNNAN